MSTNDEAAMMASCRSTDHQGGVNNGASSTISLVVGANRQRFEVQEDIICSRCPFFLNAFTGNFIESKTKTFTFPDDDPDQFAELCKWLESNSLYDVQAKPTWIWLARTWLFGDKYHIDELQNEVIDAIHTKFAAHEEGVNISFEALDYVAETTFPRSPLRRIFADMLTNGISLQQLPSRLENIPTEFLQDMCLALKTTISQNGPTNTSLLTNPISTYYISSASCKATAMPKPVNPSEMLTSIHCDGPDCRHKTEPIRDILHFCSNHNLTLCDDCRHSHRGHRKKMISLTTGPYRSAITGERATIIDGQLNDHGFYCDGPDCCLKGEARASFERSEHWVLMSGDRYHCLQCYNIDYCSVCIRGPLKCKDEGHIFLRIRPTFARKVPLTEDVTIKAKRERAHKGLCWRCGDDGHGTKDCDAKKAVLGADVEVEE